MKELRGIVGEGRDEGMRVREMSAECRDATESNEGRALVGNLYRNLL